jgi:hypothetical protein
MWIKCLHWFSICYCWALVAYFTYIYVVNWNKCEYFELVVIWMIYYSSLGYDMQHGDCCNCTLYPGNFMHFILHSIQRWCDQFDGSACDSVHFIFWKWSVYKNTSRIDIWIAEFAFHLQSNQILENIVTTSIFFSETVSCLLPPPSSFFKQVTLPYSIWNLEISLIVETCTMCKDCFKYIVKFWCKVWYYFVSFCTI